MSMILRYAKHLRRLNGVGWRAALNQPQIEVIGVKQEFYQRHLIVLDANKSYATSHAIQQEPTLGVYNISPIQALESRVKRHGRVPRIELLKALTQLQQSGMVSPLDVLFLIRCCGRLLIECTNEESINLVQELWDTCSRLDLPLDVSHYNALLNVYLEKDYDFSPSSFITSMLEKSIEPNHITYQRVIAAYCKKGDIAGAMKILEVMKEKNMPLCENIFNSLITGHSQANDLESACKILDTMKNTGILPSAETYEALMCAYAKHGDVQSIETNMEKIIQEDFTLHASALLEVFYTLAANGHVDEAEKFIDKHLHKIGTGSEIGRILVKLVNNQQLPLAMKLVTTAPEPERQYARISYIIRAVLQKEDLTADMLIKVCKDLKIAGDSHDTFRSAIYNVFKIGSKPELVIPLLKAWRDEGAEIRTHYFWPVLRSYSKQNSYGGLTEAIKTMINDFGITPCRMTLRDYVLPYMFGTWQDAIVVLTNLNIPIETIQFSILERLLIEKKMRNAAIFMNVYPMKYPKEIFLDPLIEAFVTVKHTDSFVKALRLLDRDPNASVDNETSREVIDAAVLKLVDTLPSYTNSSLIAVLNEFISHGLGISPEVAAKVKSFLQKYMTPEIEIILEQLSSGQLIEVAPRRTDSRSSPVAKSQDSNVHQILYLKKLFYQNLEYKNTKGILDALDSMEQCGAELAPAVAQALSCFCAEGNIQAAELCVAKMKKLGKHFNNAKVIQYAILLVKNHRVNDAINFLSELQPTEVGIEMMPGMRSNIRHLLEVLERTLDVENLHKVFNLLKSKNLIRIDSYFLTPLIRIHLGRHDLETALSEFQRIYKEYQCTPLKTMLTKQFIEMENADALQKITDACTELHGESNALTDLAFCFLASNRPRQAQKIFETPGLQVRSDRLLNVINWLRWNNNEKCLEQLPKVTRSVMKMDHSLLFDELLKIFDENNDWEKGLGLWTEMQETDIHPSPTFLPKLKRLLEKHGQTVPFVVTDFDPHEKLLGSMTDIEMTKRNIGQEEINNRLRGLLSRQDYNSVEEWIDSQEGRRAKVSMYYDAIEFIARNGDVDEAINLSRKVIKNCKEMSRSVLLKVAIELKDEKQLEKLKALGEVMEDRMQRNLGFSKTISMGYIRVHGLKAFLEKTDMTPSTSTPRAIENSIHFGGILKGLLAEPDALPQLEAKAYELMKHGIERPMHVLWNYYLIKGSPKATELWNQFVSKSNSPLIMPLIDYAIEHKDPSVLDQIAPLIKDRSDVSLQARVIFYTGLMKVYNAMGAYEESLKIFQSACTQFHPTVEWIREMKIMRRGLQKSGRHNSSAGREELSRALQGIHQPWTVDVQSSGSKSVE